MSRFVLPEDLEYIPHTVPGKHTIKVLSHKHTAGPLMKGHSDWRIKDSSDSSVMFQHGSQEQAELFVYGLSLRTEPTVWTRCGRDDIREHRGGDDMKHWGLISQVRFQWRSVLVTHLRGGKYHWMCRKWTKYTHHRIHWKDSRNTRKMDEIQQTSDINIISSRVRGPDLILWFQY